MASLDQAFESLFFGSGSWLGISLMLILILSFQLKWKYVGVLFLPVTIFMGLDYVGHDMSWHALIMLFASLFMAIYMVKGKGR